MLNDQSRESPKKRQQDEMLDLELEDSFPASDPPQTTQPYVKPGGPYRADKHVRDEGKREWEEFRRARGR